MDGQELYKLWAESNEEENVGIDDWEQLDPVDTACWESLASKIASFYSIRGAGDIDYTTE